MSASENFIELPAFEVAPELVTNDSAGALVGKLIGHYRIESLIGVGGMGEVYLARDERLGRKAALKLLPDSLTTDETQLSRFKNEARTASALNHPNILTVYEIGAEGNRAIHCDGVHRRRHPSRVARVRENECA